MDILLFLLAALFAVTFIPVLFSHAFAWYEAANRDLTLLDKRFAPDSLWLAARLCLQETFFVTLTLLAHPFGWTTPRLAPPASAQTPVLLLHGLFQSRACWFLLRLRLWRRGFRNVYALSLPPWKDVEALTERVDRAVVRLRQTPGVERVDLVGHSMGGLIARNYVQLRGGAERVGRCVLLGTPHGGSRLAPFAVSRLGLHALPGSELLQRLNAAPWPDEVSSVNLFTRHDNIVIPAASAKAPFGRNLEFSGIGHTGLLFHPGVLREVIGVLQEPPA